MCVSSSSIHESQLKSSSMTMDEFKSTMKQGSPFDASGSCVYQMSLCSTDVSSSEDISCEEDNNELFFATATARSTSHRRSVHFDVDESDAIIEYHYVYPKNECFDSYTTGDEQDNNATQLRRECSQMKRSNSQLIHRLNDVYENEEYGNDTKIFNDWVASNLRGFESKFISESEFQVRAYVESAIIYYHHLQDVYSQPSYGEVEDDIDDILRSLIIKNSQRSSDIAIRLAAADEIEAQQL